MKRHLALLFTLALPLSAQIRQPAGAATPFEEPPTLRAADILRPEFAAGPFHKVRDAVPTYAGANWFTIDSDFGVFEAEGNALLAQRIAEIYAIAGLKEISRGEQFGKAVANAAKSPLLAAKSLITQPVKTVSAVPKGMWKMLTRVGQGAKEATQSRERSDYEDSKAKELIGVTKAKRELASKLGVDPYSSNEALQRELNSISWASFAGDTTVGVLFMAVGGGAGKALSVTGTIDRNQDRLRDSTPADIRRENLSLLVKMGITKDSANTLLNNSAFSPWHQMNIVSALGALEGVKGRAEFVRLAAQLTEDENDALFFEQTAILIARVHAESAKLDRIVVRDGLPLCIARDGMVILALHWDYAAWTPRAAAFAAGLEKIAAKESKKPALAVMLTGQISPLLRSELEARKFHVFDRVVPGPLK